MSLAGSVLLLTVKTEEQVFRVKYSSLMQETACNMLYIVVKLYKYIDKDFRYEWSVGVE